MGGQNHQPTSTITLIAPSAWLSQKLGEGFIAVLEANNRLEDAMMQAVDRRHVEYVAPELPGTARFYLEETVTKLGLSLTKIDEIQSAYDNLLDAAAKENYAGNPLASELKELNLAAEFSGRLVVPEVNRSAWALVENHVSKHNILQTLRWERDQFGALRVPTVELIEVIESCQEVLNKKSAVEFVQCVELNQIPLRQRYARVFSLWNHMQAMFLYSALMMTELFYRTNGLPSLLEDAPVPKQIPSAA